MGQTVLGQMRNVFKPLTRSIAAIAVAVTGACAFLEDPTEEVRKLVSGPDAPPLPGKRIAVLEDQRNLKPDPELKGRQILLPAPFKNPEWPQSGGYPNHAMHHVAVGKQLERAWRSSAGDGSSSEEKLIGSPVVAGGRVYTIDTKAKISAFDVESGDDIWDVEVTPEEQEDSGHIPGGIAFDGGFLFVATGFGDLVALNAETGAEVWRKSFNASLRAAPTVRGGRVFVVTLDNRTIAVRADNGEEIWEHTGITEQAILLGSASAAVDSGVVVVPYSSGELVALKADNGRVLWSDSLASLKRTDIVSALSHIRGRPIIDRGRVFAVSHSGLMAAYDLRTGERLWDKEVGGTESPWVAGDYIFLITTDAELVALSRDTGQVYWVRGLPRFDDPTKRLKKPIIWTGPLLASDRLIVAGSQGEAWAFSPYSGKFIGLVDLPDGVTVPPVVANGSVYFLAEDANLVAYR